ncbi:MAG: hypothetical protein AABW68_04940, partial [archaeon]
MGVLSPPSYWILFFLFLGVGMEYYSASSVVHPSSVGEIFSLSLPVRVEVGGWVENSRLSGGARVFDLVDGGQ